MDDLEALIEELKGDGSFDSQGNFSLSSEQSLKKLAQSRLGDPNVYVLALFRGLVAGGARKVSVDWDLDDFWLNFDGPDLPMPTCLGLPHPDSPRSQGYLALGLLGALSLNPEFVRYRGPAGGWEFRSQTRSAIPMAQHLGPSQIQIRRRLGTKLLLSAARQLFQGLPEVNILRQRCGVTDLQFDLKGESVRSHLKVSQPWEYRSSEIPRLRLSATPKRLQDVPAPPIPLCAVFSLCQGQGELRLFLAGAEVEAKPLPWLDCQIAVSAFDVDMDLSGDQWVESRAFQDLMVWLKDRWLEVLTHNVSESPWAMAVGREALQIESPIRERLQHEPLFDGYSMQQFGKALLPRGGFPPDLEQMMAEAGAKFCNGDLSRVLRQHPLTRGEMMRLLWLDAGLKWAVPSAAEVLRGSLSEGTLSTIERFPGPSSPSLSVFADELIRALNKPNKHIADPALLILAYLEAGLACKNPVSTLSRPNILGRMEICPLHPGITVAGLFQHFQDQGELTLRSRPGEGFRVPQPIGQRIFHGMLSSAVTWNGILINNGLAAHSFAALPAVSQHLATIQGDFASVRAGATGFSNSVFSGGLSLDTAAKVLRWKEGGSSRSLAISDVSSAAAYQRSTGYDNKSRTIYILAMSTGLDNFLFSDMGVSHYEGRGDSDNGFEVSSGFDVAVKALRSFLPCKIREMSSSH